MRSAPTLVIIGLVALASSAEAKDFNYRVCGIEPSANGACLLVTYDNVPRGQVKPKAALFVHKKDPINLQWQNSNQASAGMRTKTGGIRVGEFDWVGTAKEVVRVKLDYGKLGLTPGEKIWTDVNFFWPGGVHQWGDSVAGRLAGGPHVLPPLSGTSNSRLFRRAPTTSRFRSWRPPSRPRWTSSGSRSTR